LSEQLREIGADVLEVPTIRIQTPDDPQSLVEALSGLGEYDWAVFTSPKRRDQLLRIFLQGLRRHSRVGQSGGLRPSDRPRRPSSTSNTCASDVMPKEYVTSKIVHGPQGI